MAQRPFKRQQTVRKGATTPRKRKKRVSSSGGSGGKKSGSGILSKIGGMIPGPEAIARFIVIMGIWGLVIGGGIVAYYGYGLPEKISFEVASERKPSIRVISVDGAVLGSYGDRYGSPVEVSDLPDHVGLAFASIEDRRFYDHFGIDILGILRASWVNLTSGRIAEGGSTITQQLAKNLFLSPERNFGRKIEEVLLALWLEFKFTKQQILSLYLNRIYFGSGMYGIDAASRHYFGTDPRRLNLYEAAVLAGLPKAPSRYNPLVDPEDSAKRANVVLDAMASNGVITAARAERAKQRTVRTTRQGKSGPGVRYFTDWVLDRVRDYIGYVDQDLTIHTTLDSRLQEIAEFNLERALASPVAQQKNVGQAALLAMTPDGAVRAMVGGRDYFESQYNRVTQARRQPGSVFKLFVYLAALDKGIGSNDWMRDMAISINGWEPRNFDRKHHGTMSIRDAVATSNNSIAVQVAMEVGLDNVIKKAHDMGVSSELGREPSLALGTSEVSMLDLTGAYAIVANGGFSVFPHAIRKIVGQGGVVLFERSDEFPVRLMNPLHAGEMNNMLSSVVAKGTGRNAIIDRPAAGKTGTTSDSRDAWFIGYTAELVAGVWMGNDNGSPMDDVSGGDLPAKLWHDFMLHAHQNLPVRSLGKAALARSQKVGEDGSWREFTSGFTTGNTKQ
ncbi:transglycosylase domain-containing protein [Thalassospira xianhensis]|uniref:peptidoglycan glycosyltransferase n=1 Tax=Thalassospira xianhensis MCCC 1A02616 TaxID=1177929 RepID=A0A367UD13_9PROT|nr:PBP1A family penicillin-binding protein [Thalassospira xianhensis]RCK06206.1 penicillin-binding protein [Thalassospira xianhensis MCCC 1A02616]